VPPSFAQCLQYLQFLHALHRSEPVHVAEKAGIETVIRAIKSKQGRIFMGFLEGGDAHNPIHIWMNVK
jgi:hypothetical protein